MTRLITISILCLLLAGCATKGGWPCWAWQKNTDQKNEAAGKEYLRTNNIPPHPDMLHGKPGPETSMIDAYHAAAVAKRKAAFATGQPPCGDDVVLSTNHTGPLYIVIYRDGCDGSTNSETWGPGSITYSNLTTGDWSVQKFVVRTSMTMTWGPPTPEEEATLDTGMPLVLAQSDRLTNASWMPVMIVELRRGRNMTKQATVTNLTPTVALIGDKGYFRLQWGQ